MQIFIIKIKKHATFCKLHILKSYNIDVDSKMSFFEQALNSTSERSHRNSNRKQRDVSTTVDMTSTRFSVCGATAILLSLKIAI